MNLVNWLKFIIAALGGFFSWLFGDLAPMVVVVFVLMFIDYITGIIAATVTKTLSSRIGVAGILKKVCIMLIIGVAAVVDFALTKYVNPEAAVCLGVVCFFYAANEFLSILENLGRAGVAYPDKLKQIILILNKKAEPPSIPLPDTTDSTDQLNN